MIKNGHLPWMSAVVTGGGSAVLCIGCETKLAQLPNGVQLVHQKLEVGELGGFVCERCGGVLPAKDPAEIMLSKLSLLSRFGLGADDRPLFSTPQGEER